MNTFIDKLPSSIPQVRFLDKYMAGHNGFIAGGCFKNIFLGNKIKDIDIFFENEDDFKKADGYFYDSIEYVETYKNERVQAYKNTETDMCIELIKGTFGTPEEVMSVFDFSITKFAYCKREVEQNDGTGIEYYCLYHNEYFEHLVLKKLVLEEDIKFPVSTFERSYRYRSYGFGLCRESKRNLLNALQGVDTDDMDRTLYFGLD